MKIISHRGNLNGRVEQKENEPSYVMQAIDRGFDVEVDVWFVENSFFLGHDFPQHMINPNWLMKKSLWCHAKNVDAFCKMMSMNINCFWHETDKITITSKGIPWCYPNTFIENGITVCLGTDRIDKNIFGICTDYPLHWEKILL